MLSILVVTFNSFSYLTLLSYGMQPGPRESLIRCFIKRNRHANTFDLFLSLTQGEQLMWVLNIVCSEPCGSLQQKSFYHSLCFLYYVTVFENTVLHLIFLAALSDDGKFLLAARKCKRATGTDYIISLHIDYMFKGSNKYIGKLRCVLISMQFKGLLFFSFRGLIYLMVFFTWQDLIFWEPST